MREDAMRDLEELMTFLRAQPPAASLPLADRRRLYDRAERAFALPEGVQVAAWSEGGLQGELLKVAGAADRQILYLHGGGYGIGSPRSHRHLAAAIGVAARADVLVPDYRLAPEHACPAALEDAAAAYRALQEMAPGAARAVMGDSAGGGLAVAMLVALREQGISLPAAGACLSPWVDLHCDPAGPVAQAAADDPLVAPEDLASYAAAYLGGRPATDPLASPIHADLRGLPPLLIQAGDAEALRFDAQRLAEAARAAGVAAELELTTGAPHVWHWFWPRLQIGREAIERIGTWLEPRWAAQQG